VMLIGDSQSVGWFGNHMEGMCHNFGVSGFTREARSGYGVGSWNTRRGILERTANRLRPTIVIVELGGNDWSRARSSTYAATVQDFWTFVRETLAPPGAFVFWVSPARVVGENRSIQPSREGVSHIIYDTVGKDSYIDSLLMTSTFGRAPDGVHFGSEGAREWARLVLQQVSIRVHENRHRP
jgi:lysophospholipase L1-like esterase